MVQIWDKVPALEDTIARIDGVTTGDLRTFAEEIATQAPAALALYGPVSGAPDLAQLTERRAA